ncbi:aminopeptidase [Paenibacillus sp. FJAT-26967]|uniref:aminopeptidase n=1 Tax=Paenibacillus sp. FJAT-26967 TaxID=1729690 RepID=UPI0008396FAE|nr:aminopeptidase [Paenibacillus sp. FJAT-26967]
MTFESNLDKYADLAVKVAVNLQPGQDLWINAPIHMPEFVRLITRKAYEAGAKHVHIEWQDEICTRIKYEHAPEEAFEEYPAWRVKALEDNAENGGAYLFIESGNPELLKDVDGKRVAAFSKSAGTALAKWRTYMTSYKMTWSIIAAPSAEWAKKVFPGVSEEEAIRALWEAIFKATRADQDNPVKLWGNHNDVLSSKREELSAKQYKKLHYRAPGTNLTVELPHNHIWRGGTANNAKGEIFNPNVPTEEVFVSPHRAGTSGIVRSTKPLSFQGKLIENFSLTFENGRVVDFQAEKGYDALSTMLNIDEGARYLGEIALVPDDSPISNSNLIFYNTLFDENASCHLAIGRSFAFCVENGTSMSPEELHQAGLNDSLTHVDFMIGSPDMEIDGELADGTLELIFRSGNWAV